MFHQRAVQRFYSLRQRRRGFEVAVMKAAKDFLGYRAVPIQPPLANLSADWRAELAAILQPPEVPTAASRNGTHAAA